MPGVDKAFFIAESELYSAQKCFTVQFTLLDPGQIILYVFFVSHFATDLFEYIHAKTPLHLTRNDNAETGDYSRLQSLSNA
jgi:hypothetical protein